MNVRRLNRHIMEMRLALTERQKAWWADQPRGPDGRFSAKGGVGKRKVKIGDVEVELGDESTPAAEAGREQLDKVFGDKSENFDVGEDENGNVRGKHKDVDETFTIGKSLTDTLSNLVGYFDLVSSLAVKAVGYSAVGLAKAASDLREGLQMIGAL